MATGRDIMGTRWIWKYNPTAVSSGVGLRGTGSDKRELGSRWYVEEGFMLAACFHFIRLHLLLASTMSSTGDDFGTAEKDQFSSSGRFRSSLISLLESSIIGDECYDSLALVYNTPS